MAIRAALPPDAASLTMQLLLPLISGASYHISDQAGL